LIWEKIDSGKEDALLRFAKKFGAEFEWFEDFAKIQMAIARGADFKEALVICEKMIRNYTENALLMTFKAIILVGFSEVCCFFS
jgi:hypothetical protein